MHFSRITIIHTTTTPDERNINEMLQWFGGTLGLFNPRDKDKSCYRIFLSLVKGLKTSPQGLTSDELALDTGLSRGTTIHHLNKLMAAGIVTSQRARYSLRVETLEELVNTLRKNVNKTLDNLSEVSRYLDNALDL
jgi:DNA-binding transcriptional ArsR family regulator